MLTSLVVATQTLLNKLKEELDEVDLPQTKENSIKTLLNNLDEKITKLLDAAQHYG